MFDGPAASKASKVAAQESTMTSLPFHVKSGFVSKSEMVDLIFSIVAACDFAKVSTASVGVAWRGANFVRVENGACAWKALAICTKSAKRATIIMVQLTEVEDIMVNTTGLFTVVCDARKFVMLFFFSVEKDFEHV